MKTGYVVVFALAVWLSFAFAVMYLNGGGIVHLAI